LALWGARIFKKPLLGRVVRLVIWLNPSYRRRSSRNYTTRAYCRLPTTVSSKLPTDMSYTHKRQFIWHIRRRRGCLRPRTPAGRPTGGDQRHEHDWPDLLDEQWPAIKRKTHGARRQPNDVCMSNDYDRTNVKNVTVVNRSDVTANVRAYRLFTHL